MKTRLRNNPYLILFIIYSYFIVFAFIVDTPYNIFHGLFNIYKMPGILITDYVEIGGLGSAIFNAGTCGLYVLAIYKLNDVKLNGSLIMTAWMIVGFAFFGKNIVNMTPIIFGGYLYSKVKQEKFQKYMLISLLSTSLSPVVFQINYVLSDYSNLTMFFGICIGTAIGFITPSISANAMKSSGGYNLYNVGFSAGLIGIAIMGVYRTFGLDFPLASYWNTTNSEILGLFVFSICIFYLLLGLYLGENKKENLSRIFKSHGKLVTDFYAYYEDSTYINTGILGLIGLFVLYLIEAPVNGPTVGAIFTIVAFSFLGKQPFNIIPVMLGALIGGIFGVHSLSSPGVILGILFSTGLAPIAGTFGFLSGVLAGFTHLLIVTEITYIHGGLNLYNNGLAAGLVSMILVPVFIAFRRGDYN